MTDRIVINRTSPSTRFILEADTVGLGLIHMYLRAENTGNTTSYDNNAGWQAALIDGYGEFGRYSAKPFQVKGLGGGARRWRVGPYGAYVGDPAGGVTLRMTLHYGNTAVVGHAIQPQAPSPTWFGDVQATELTYMFSGRGNGGAAIEAWECQLATSPGFEAGTIVSHVRSSGTTRFTNLMPATRYYARSRGLNSLGWGWWSATGVVDTLSGARLHTGGVLRHAVPYVWTGNGWKRAVPHIYNLGKYKIPR